MSGKTLLVVVALALAAGTGIGLLVIKAMEEGHSVGVGRPARKAPNAGGVKSTGRRPAGKDLREFMKLVSRSRWLGAGAGQSFRKMAGAWQDAIEGRNAGIGPLVGDAALADATIAYLLWDKGSRRAREVGKRLQAAGMKSTSPAEALAIYRVLTASGYPYAAELRPVLQALVKTAPGARPVKASGPESCKLWAEISGLRPGLVAPTRPAPGARSR